MNIGNKEILYIVLGVLLVIWLGISQIKCNRLRNQLNEERIKNLEQVDSLYYINKQHLNAIKTYEFEVSELKSEIDSLQQLKNKIIVKKDGVIVSNNVSSAVNQLKQNLKSWND